LAFLGASALSADDTSIVDKIVRGILHNDNQMGSIRATIQEHHHDKSVSGEKRVQVSSNATAIWYADSWASIEFISDGENFRSVRRPSHNNDITILSKKAGEWTRFSEGKGEPYAIIWAPDQLPGMFPIDPREFGCDSLTERLVDVLRKHKIVSTETIRDKDNVELIRVTTRRPTSEVNRSWDFDPQRGYMLVRRFNSWPNDKSLLQVVEIDYREVLAGEARFPIRMVRRFFDKGVAKGIDSEDWRVEIERVVTKLDVRSPDHTNVTGKDIEIELKQGTRVDDMIRRRSFVRK
jgi:hypothetical protein